MTTKPIAVLTALFALTGCLSVSEESYVLPVKGGAESQTLGQGLLLTADKPMKVIASHSGQVVAVEGRRREPRTVVVDHGGGVRGRYSGLSRVSVSRGKWVKTGHKIGWVSQKGSEQASFGFELTLAEMPVPPLDIIEAPKMKKRTPPPVRVTLETVETTETPVARRSAPAYPPGYDKYGPIPGYTGPSAAVVATGPQKKKADSPYPPGYDKYGPIVSNRP